MAFGYLLVRRLLPLVRLFGRLPDRFSRGFASALNAQTENAQARHMHFPVGWDPFFRDTMTLEQVYHYATAHYDFHRSQLTSSDAAEPADAS